MMIGVTKHYNPLKQEVIYRLLIGIFSFKIKSNSAAGQTEIELLSIEISKDYVLKKLNNKSAKPNGVHIRVLN